MKKITLMVAVFAATFSMKAQDLNTAQKYTGSTNNETTTFGTNDVVVSYPIGAESTGYVSVFGQDPQGEAIAGNVLATSFEVTAETSIKAIRVFGFQPEGALESRLVEYDIFVVPNGENDLPSLAEGAPVVYQLAATTQNNIFKLEKGTQGPLYTYIIDVENDNGGFTLAPGTYWIISIPIVEYTDQAAMTQETLAYWLLSDVESPLPAAANGENGFETFAPEDATGPLAFAFEMEDEGGFLAVTNLDKNKFMHYNTNELLMLSANTPMSKITVYNMLGKQVLNNNINSTSKEVKIGDLASGIYIAQVQIEGQQKSFKFVKK